MKTIYTSLTAINFIFNKIYTLLIFIYLVYTAKSLDKKKWILPLITLYCKTLSFPGLNKAVGLYLTQNMAIWKTELDLLIGFQVLPKLIRDKHGKLSLEITLKTDKPLELAQFIILVFFLLQHNLAFIHLSQIKSLICIGYMTDSTGKEGQKNVGSTFLWDSKKSPSLNEWMSHYMDPIHEMENKQAYAFTLLSLGWIVARDVDEYFQEQYLADPSQDSQDTKQKRKWHS